MADPKNRIVATSETGQGTRIRTTRVDRGDAQGPDLDVDELLEKRDVERRSKDRWMIAIDGGAIYWAYGGGYTRLRSNALKYESRWDAVDGIRGKLKWPHRWNVEAENQSAPRSERRGRDTLTYDDIEQVWVGVLVLQGRGSRRVPGDGLVHAHAADDGTRAMCGIEVGSWRKRAWPPRAMPACERCSAEVESALRNARRR